MSESNQGNTIQRDKVENLSQGEPAWLKENRLAAWESYLQCPMPTSRDENWKSTTVDHIDLSKLAAVETIKEEADGTPNLPLLQAAINAVGKPGAIYLEDYAQGKSCRRLEQAVRAKAVTFSPLAEAVTSHGDLLQKLLQGKAHNGKTGLEDKFTLMNKALWTGGLFVHVPKGVTVEAPLVVMVNLPTKNTNAEGTTDSKTGKKAPSGQAVFPRIIVVAEANSSINFVMVTGSQPGADKAKVDGTLTLASSVVEFHIEDGAKVSVSEITNCTDDVFVVNRTRAFVGKDATIDFTAAGLGAKQIKSDIETILTAPGAQTDVRGVVLGDKNERYAYNTIAEHAAPDTRSNILFRVALKDKSASIYQGNVIVDKIAQRTDAFQSNKNLLLGKEAKADSIPKLEILADDVKCSHGATVGPVDKEQLFYLTCRGLSTPEAEELIVTGFFQQVLDTTPIAGVGQWLADMTAEKIHGADAQS